MMKSIVSVERVVMGLMHWNSLVHYGELSRFGWVASWFQPNTRQGHQNFLMLLNWWFGDTCV